MFREDSINREINTTHNLSNIVSVSRSDRVRIYEDEAPYSSRIELKYDTRRAS